MQTLHDFVESLRHSMRGRYLSVEIKEHHCCVSQIGEPAVLFEFSRLENRKGVFWAIGDSGKPAKLQALTKVTPAHLSDGESTISQVSQSRCWLGVCQLFLERGTPVWVDCIAKCLIIGVPELPEAGEQKVVKLVTLAQANSASRIGKASAKKRQPALAV